MKFLVALSLLISISNIQVLSLEEYKINEVARTNNKFALKLHKTFDAKGNVFSSPLSAFIALGMLYSGARGPTRVEIRQALSFDSFGTDQTKAGSHFKELLHSLSGTSGSATVKISNALFSQISFPVSEKFKRILSRNYNAIIKGVDFTNDAKTAVDEINDWVRNNTEGKITKLAESLESDTVLALLNAIYFKAKWEIPFDPENVVRGQFFNNGVQEVPVHLMSMGGYYPHGNFDKYELQAIKLLYASSNFSMLILLPEERDGVSSVENRLTLPVLDDILSNLEEKNVAIRLPKFKLEGSRKLKHNMEELGIKSVFTDLANFKTIVEPDPFNEETNLKANDIVHMAVMDVVFQYSTEAAGATNVAPSTPLYVETTDFLVNHPFLFFIRHEVSGTILFIGRVSEV